MNLKTRVARLFTGIVTLFVVAQGVLAYLSLEEQEDDLVDEIVITETHRLTTLLEQPTVRNSSAEMARLLPAQGMLLAWLVDHHGQVNPSPIPEHLIGLPDGTHRDGRKGHYLHIAVMSTPHGRLFVQYDAQKNETKVHTFGLYLMGLAMACIGLGAILSKHVAQWAVGPLERLTQRLSAWTPEENSMTQTGLTTKRNPNTTIDQEYQLLEAFKRVQDRFERSLAHERTFIDNISHEIRTPLAVLRTDLELCAQTLNTQAAERPRLERALKAIDNIVGSLDAARTITSRQTTPKHIINVRTCAEDAWASVQPPLATPVPELLNEIAYDTKIIGDRHALLTILRNLMRNAIEHASAKHCVVRFSQDAIRVLDDGTGIAPEHMNNIFERYWRGHLSDSLSNAAATSSDARGIGLAIARQMADLNEWHIHAQPANTVDPRFAQGSCFTITGLILVS